MEFDILSYYIFQTILILVIVFLIGTYALPVPDPEASPEAAPEAKPDPNPKPWWVSFSRA